MSIETLRKARRWRLGPVQFGYTRLIHVYALPDPGRRYVLQPWIFWDYGRKP